MPNTWSYMDVYDIIIHYITNCADPTNYMLNFGIIALHESQTQSNCKVYIKRIQEITER